MCCVSGDVSDDVMGLLSRRVMGGCVRSVGCVGSKVVCVSCFDL